MTATALGTGRLSWSSAERRTDRYGAVFLMIDGDSLTETSGYLPIDPGIAGRRGTLVAEVVETRESTHIGDLFRGLFPETPDVGERIVLGTGVVFVAHESWGPDVVGVYPADGRDTDWLDPKALYRVHEQTVNLLLLEDA